MAKAPKAATKLSSQPLAYSYVRFSTPEQLKGNSLQRQTELSEEYAREHGLKLDRSLKLQDLGISAHHSKNSTEGALADFFTAIKSGRVAPGSTLLVESLDRLSRDQITNALTQFLNIINAGLTVVTLMDKMVYSRETINTNPGSLMMSIVIMLRAYEESAAKSHRLKKAWEGKRQKARETGKRLNSRCPGWLRPTATGYEMIPERAAVVKRIFKLTADGLGKRSIAKILNREKVDTFGGSNNCNRKSNAWHDSYVIKIVSSPTVLGIFQPGRIDPATRKRVEIGEPIEGYYPRVISDEEWQAAHARPSAPRGPRPVRIANLFSGIVWDGYTGAKMLYSDKSSANQNRKRGDGRYLYSDIIRTSGEKGQNWPYGHFERAVLHKLSQVDWSSLSNKPKDDGSTLLASQIAALEIKASKLQKDIDRFLDSFADAPAALQKAAGAKAAKTAEELEETQARIVNLQVQQAAAKAEHSAMTEGVAEFRALIASGDPEKRLALQTEIRRRVGRITVYRHGKAKIFKGTSADTITHPTLEIEFKNGARQVMITEIKRIPPSALTQKRGPGGQFIKKTPEGRK